MGDSAPRPGGFRWLAWIVAAAVWFDYSTAQVVLRPSRIQLAASVLGDTTLRVNRVSRTVIRAQATDEQGRPLRRAVIVFVVLPSATGASAVFVGGGQTAQVVTDDMGFAQVVIERGVGSTGPFEVRVNATFEQLEASQLITLKNVAGTTIGPMKWVAILGAIGGGVAIIPLAMGKENKRTSQPPTQSVTRVTDGPVVVK